MIAIIDYEMGNLKSASKALEHVGARVVVTRDAKIIKNASKVILPGVGAFKHCMEALDSLELIDVIKTHIKSGKWLLGICLGFQVLFDQSDEFGGAEGLGFIKGHVKKFQLDDQSLKVPHMGWNAVSTQGAPVLFKGIPEESDFYFVHSFYADPESNYTGGLSHHGHDFCAAIEVDNVLGTQFHPEKSQASGLKLLKNFAELKD